MRLAAVFTGFRRIYVRAGREPSLDGRRWWNLSARFALVPAFLGAAALLANGAAVAHDRIILWYAGKPYTVAELTGISYPEALRKIAALRKRTAGQARRWFPPGAGCWPNSEPWKPAPGRATLGGFYHMLLQGSVNEFVLGRMVREFVREHPRLGGIAATGVAKTIRVLAVQHDRYYKWEVPLLLASAPDSAYYAGARKFVIGAAHATRNQISGFLHEIRGTGPYLAVSLFCMPYSHHGIPAPWYRDYSYGLILPAFVRAEIRLHRSRFIRAYNQLWGDRPYAWVALPGDGAAAEEMRPMTDFLGDVTGPAGHVMAKPFTVGLWTMNMLGVRPRVYCTSGSYMAASIHYAIPLSNMQVGVPIVFPEKGAGIRFLYFFPCQPKPVGKHYRLNYGGTFFQSSLNQLMSPIASRILQQVRVVKGFHVPAYGVLMIEVLGVPFPRSMNGVGVPQPNLPR